MGRLANLQIVPFSKKKPGRSTLQRLSDSRRSLALGGLALGVVFSAGFFRRKRRPAEIEFERPAPAPSKPAPSATASSATPASTPVPSTPSSSAAAPSASAASTPAASAATPASVANTPAPSGDAEPDSAPATDSSEASSGEGAINATAGTPAEPAPTPSEPATGELSAEEASILSVLAQSGRADDDRTSLAVATSLERETSDVAEVLRKLSAEGVVSGDLYTAGGAKIWSVTERGVRRLGAQH
jgi:hypothetical protein